jgi:hypothetical protein
MDGRRTTGAGRGRVTGATRPVTGATPPVTEDIRR